MAILGAEYPGPNRLTFSIMVGLYKPQKVQGYLLSYKAIIAYPARTQETLDLPGNWRARM